MNKTYGDLMGEYENVRDSAKRFGSWATMDKFVEELVRQVTGKQVERIKLTDFAPPVVSPVEKTELKFSFDGNGAPVEHE